MSEETQLTACHQCDLLLAELVDPAARGVVLCPRCGAKLGRRSGGNLEQILALTATALVLLLLANIFPVVGLNLQGHQVETSLYGAASQLWRDDMPLVGALLLVTTTLIPLLELSVLAWLVWPLWRGRRPAGFVFLFRAMQLAHPWAMVEVFLLGVLVALVKLSHLADILLGPALLCLAALMLILTSIGDFLDPHEMWQAWEAAT